MNNPIKNFTKKEWILWIASLFDRNRFQFVFYGF